MRTSSPSIWLSLFLHFGGATRAPKPSKLGFPTAYGLCPFFQNQASKLCKVGGVWIGPQSKFLLPANKAARLEKSWAHVFRINVMPLIDEETFRDAFCDDNGRPNQSILLLMGAHVLKHWNDLTDAQVIEQVEFNLQWQYALNVTPDDANLVQQTMHSFRKKLLDSDRARRMFEDITHKLAAVDGITLGRQRLDSTHVISNIAVLTRLTLFVETITKFLRALRTELPERLDDVATPVRRRYLEREGSFNDAKREQAKRQLPVVASDVDGLVALFCDDKAVSAAFVRAAATALQRAM